MGTQNQVRALQAQSSTQLSLTPGKSKVPTLLPEPLVICPVASLTSLPILYLTHSTLATLAPCSLKHSKQLPGLFICCFLSLECSSPRYLHGFLSPSIRSLHKCCLPGQTSLTNHSLLSPTSPPHLHYLLHFPPHSVTKQKRAGCLPQLKPNMRGRCWCKRREVLFRCWAAWENGGLPSQRLFHLPAQAQISYRE